MADFLLEIGLEEIPARMIDTARDELAQRVAGLLTRERLVDKVDLETLSTPRRLGVVVRSIQESQADVEEQVTGPATKVAFKDGQPTPAAHAFARKVGLDVTKLDRITTPKGEYLAARVVRKGRAAGDILAESLPKEIAALYWPKNMYWRAGKPERFVRPVRWIVALLGGEIVPLEFAGIVAGNDSRGHRLLSSGPVHITRPDQYKEELALAHVLDQATREHNIRKTLDAATRSIHGARWREDKDLLSTVVNLTEYPSVILGSFDPEFLALPEEVLVTVMRDHQKYFAVEDAAHKLAPYFLAVLNIDADREGIIRHGNERVLRARFNDARFFWDTDQKIPLKQRVEMLRAVTFQKELGSYCEKSSRMHKLADAIADELARADVMVDKAALLDSVWLAKTDLTTELVREFTELQGIVGGLYATAQGLGSTIAGAIYDQYKPQSMEDSVPRSTEGAVLAIADKADSIAGMFALGLIPSGSKDPFALRRQANGIVKIIAEHKLPLSIAALFRSAHNTYNGTRAQEQFSNKIDFGSSIAGFFRERLEFYLRDTLGYAYDVVNAALAAGADDIVDASERARAVAKVRPSGDFEAISTSFKRMKNILRQAREAGKWTAPAEMAGNVKVIAESGDPAEKDLAIRCMATAVTVNQLRQQKQYEQALTEISKLRPTVDVFFDKVMVMVDDERVRSNRLALLQTLVNEFTTIADFSEIVTESRS